MKKTYHIGNTSIKFTEYSQVETFLKNTNQKIVASDERPRGKKCDVYLTVAAQ